MKADVKPELYYESFELSRHIAGCNVTLTTADALTCTATGYDNFGNPVDNVFSSEGVCNVILEDYCYTNGLINISNMFS